MSAPPNNPMVYNENEVNYFEYLALLANPILEKDNINLNFSGYRNTIEKYNNLNVSLTKEEMEKVLSLSVELNAWSHYFSELSNLIQMKYLDSETEKIRMQSKSSLLYNDKNVSAGDRFANTDEKVVEARKNRNILKGFYDELVSKTKFLERAHYHCKSICGWYVDIETSFVSQV